MRVATIIMMCFIFFMTFQVVDGRYHNRNFVKNLNKSIVKGCNKQALIATNNNDVYNCIMNQNKNCHELQNYAEYVNISNSCMKIQREQFGAGILFTVSIWFGLAMFAMIFSGV
jgi:hypothetical protein